MSVVVQNPTRTGKRTWKYTWTGTAPYDIFNYETYQYIKTGYTATTIEVYGQSDLQPPPLEITDADSTGTIDGLLYPGQITIQWRGKPDAYEYIIRDDANAEVGRIKETGRGYYTYAARVADDNETVQYSVNVIDVNEVESLTALQSIVVIRNPSYVKIDLSYNAGTGNLTISEAVE